MCLSEYKFIHGFGRKNLKEIDSLKDLDMESNIILKYMLEDITLESVGYMYLA